MAKLDLDRHEAKHVRGEQEEKNKVLGQVNTEGEREKKRGGSLRERERKGRERGTPLRAPTCRRWPRRNHSRFRPAPCLRTPGNCVPQLRKQIAKLENKCAKYAENSAKQRAQLELERKASRAFESKLALIAKTKDTALTGRFVSIPPAARSHISQSLQAGTMVRPRPRLKLAGTAPMCGRGSGVCRHRRQR